MKKLANVHMLPTEDRTNIFQHLQEGIFYENNIGKINHFYLNDNIKFYNLYFTTDEKIKEGDWVYNKLSDIGKYLGKGELDDDCVIIYNHQGWEVSEDIESIRKIVATTDKSLFIENWYKSIDLGNQPRYDNLPQIPQQFIEEYVKAGGIDEVLLEYNTKTLMKPTDVYLEEIKTTPKLDQNNCVITHPVEPKLYTKEELLRDYINYHYVEGNITNEQRVKMEFAAAAYLQKIELCI